MNKQRKVVITTTYNEMGIIIDTKVEEVAQPELSEEDRRLLKELRSFHNGSYAKVIDRLMSAQPETHEGYWIPHEGIDGDIQYECSECGVLWEFNDGTPEDNEAYFCPKCGERMRGAQNG